MIADMFSNKELNPIVTSLFIRGRKLNIYFVFITQSYFSVPKNIRLNSTHYFIMKIPNKRELQEIACNHEFVNFYKKCAATVFFPREKNFNNANRLLEGKQKVLYGFESKIFRIEKQEQGNGSLSDLTTHLKILSP